MARHAVFCALLAVCAAASCVSGTLLSSTEHPANALTLTPRQSITHGGIVGNFPGNAEAGYSLAGCDLNGDGVEELVMGYPGRAADSGGFWMISLDPNDLSLVGDHAVDESVYLALTLTNDRLGASVVCGADLDADGKPELTVGASMYFDGTLRSFFVDSDLSLKSGLPGVGWLDIAPPMLLQLSENFGTRLAVIGDVDGNGHDDYAVGSCQYDTWDGSVTVLLMGPAQAVISQVRTSRSDNTPAGLSALDTGAIFCAVAGIGDVDNDGVPDLVVGSPLHGAGGSIWISFLNNDGTFREVAEIPADASIHASYPDANNFFGLGVATVGDIDGDGVQEVAVSDIGFDFPATNLGGFHIVSFNRSGALQWSRPFASDTNGVGTLATGEAFGSALSLLSLSPASREASYAGNVTVAVSAPGRSGGRGGVELYSLPYRRDSLSLVADAAGDDPVVTFDYATLWELPLENVTLDIRSAADDISYATVEVDVGWDGLFELDLLSLDLPVAAHEADSVVVALVAESLNASHPVLMGATNTTTARLCVPPPTGPLFAITPDPYGEHVNVSWIPFSDWGGAAVAKCGHTTREIRLEYAIDGAPAGNHTWSSTENVAAHTIPTTPGQNVSVSMFARRGLGVWETQSAIGWVSVLAPPVTSPPATLEVVCPVKGLLNFTWQAPVADHGFPAFEYQLYRHGDGVLYSGGLDQHAADGDMSLVAPATYVYGVVAVNPHGPSKPTLIEVDVEPLPGAAGLSVFVDPVHSDKLRVSWNRSLPCGVEPSLQSVELSSDAVFTFDFQSIGVSNKSASTLIALSAILSPTEPIFLRVQNVFPGAGSAVSLSSLISLALPSPPVGLAVDRTGGELEVVTATWDPVTVVLGGLEVPLVGYEAAFSPDGANWTSSVAGANVTAASVSFPMADSPREVHVRVRCITSIGAGNWSLAALTEPLPTLPVINTPSPLTPLPPAWVDLAMAGEGLVEVTWGVAPSHLSVVSSYTVTYGIFAVGVLAAPSMVSVPAAVGARTMSVVMSDLTPGLRFGFEVRSVASTGAISAPAAASMTVLWPTFDAFLPRPLLLLGGGGLQLTGSGFSDAASVAVDGMTLNSSAVDFESPEAIMVFFPPRAAAGYVDVVLTNPNGAAINLPNIVFYSATDCLEPGTFATEESAGGECGPCPENAFCPGGGRAWPDPGYWAPDEMSGSILACTPDFKCLGGSGAACAEGYEGFMCSSCTDGYFYTDGWCAPCDSPSLNLTLRLLDVAFLVILVNLIAFAPRPFLRRLAFWITLFQFVRLIAVGSRGGFSVELGLAVRGLALTTGEGVRQASPCDVHEEAFSYQYYGQLVVLYGTCVVLFAGLAAVYASARWCPCGKARTTVARKLRAAPWADRIVEGAIVSAVYTHAAAVSLAVRSLVCVPTYAGSVLAADPTVECWTGTHTGMYAVGLVVVFGHGLAMPVMLGLRLRVMRDMLHADQRTKDRYGFAYLLFRERDPYFLVYWMVFVTVVLVVLHAFRTSVAFVFAIVGVFILAFAGFVSNRRPFRKMSWNIAFTLLVFVGLLAACLAVIKSVSGDHLTMQITSFAILGLTAVLLCAFCFNVAVAVPEEDDMVSLLPTSGQRGEGRPHAGGEQRRKSVSSNLSDWWDNKNDGRCTPVSASASWKNPASSSGDNLSCELSCELGHAFTDEDDDYDLYVASGSEAEAVEMDLLDGDPLSRTSLTSSVGGLAESIAQLQERQTVARRMVEAKRSMKERRDGDLEIQQVRRVRTVDKADGDAPGRSVTLGTSHDGIPISQPAPTPSAVSSRGRPSGNTLGDGSGGDAGGDVGEGFESTRPPSKPKRVRYQIASIPENVVSDDGDLRRPRSGRNTGKSPTKKGKKRAGKSKRRAISARGKP